MTTTDLATLTAVMDRIIPSDPDWPSASQNSVWDYIRSQFSGDLAKQTPWFKVGLESLESESKLQTGTSFAMLTSIQQDELLSRIEAGNVKYPWPINSSSFFSRLTELIAEGYYSDPEHNFGNPQKISWKMIGFDERQ